MASDEYDPLPWRPADRRALARLAENIPERSDLLGTDPRLYAASRLGTAATLRAVDAEAGGGFYDIPADAEVSAEVADAALGGDELVVDVQTHLVNPARVGTAGAANLFAFLQATDPDRWGEGIDPSLIAAASWAGLVFGGSETATAVISSLPGPAEQNVLTNAEIAGVREIVDRYAGTGRVLTHTIVHPNLGVSELETMDRWAEELQPAAWKVYTLWEPRSAAVGRPRGWFLDDAEVGLPFLEKVRTTGPRIVCAHKGIGGPIPDLAPLGSSPRDIGPAAVAFPDLTFIVYHSGYDPDSQGQEGPHRRDPHRGVSRLVSSLEEAGVGPGGNVYAELGTTWFLMMRRPEEAAHVLGKLLLALGDERIVWGTDSVWYGPPQFMIDAFRAFQIPERMQEEFGYPPLTAEAKAKILGLNGAGVYGIDADRARRAATERNTWLEAAMTELRTAVG